MRSSEIKLKAKRVRESILYILFFYLSIYPRYARLNDEWWGAGQMSTTQIYMSIPHHPVTKTTTATRVLSRPCT